MANLQGSLLLVLLGFALARPAALPPEEAGPVLEAASALLAELEPVAVYQLTPRRGGGPPLPRPVEVRLGREGKVFARLALHPRSLRPLPLGFESRLPPLPPRLAPERVFELLRELLDELALANLVLEDEGGYRLLLVYRGRSVGEMVLDEALEPGEVPPWRDDFERSPWRFP